MPVPLPQAVKSKLKVWQRTLRSWYADRFLRFTPEDLRAALTRVGVRPGDTLFVHCSFGAFEGFTGNALDLIRLLQDMTGPEGTILMPNQPFAGSAVAWAKSGKVFDVKRTPSMMGIVSEFFRRLPGVVRSIHPTHPVAAWGKDAAMFIDEHWKAESPCGAGSPYGRLLERGGKVLHLGSTIHHTTFLHVFDDVLPVSPLTREVYELASTGPDGQRYTTRSYLFDEHYAPRRRMGRLVPVLQARNRYHTARISRLDILLLNTGDLQDACRELAARKEYLYDLDGVNG